MEFNQILSDFSIFQRQASEKDFQNIQSWSECTKNEQIFQLFKMKRNLRLKNIINRYLLLCCVITILKENLPGKPIL